ncbi:mitochondrial inner membrane protease ATP23 [Olea europaea subsp. europaea]|uniref:Mitochondrial inner membrane protease ATP23 n=1 Tax=Olea europaea subsp. europaea TaxID=158383 RepID=A0A8S0S9I1_OLEEU|nr:mitochondrial inner membrane protease ATP23 [Olea europaea subsp. europaea]
MYVYLCASKYIAAPMVKFLKEHLEKSGCNIGSNFIKAVRCDKKVSGGYLRGEGIVVCSNHLKIQDEVNQVVIHELIHAYDDCRAANLDWSDCAHHACSEVKKFHLFHGSFLLGFILEFISYWFMYYVYTVYEIRFELAILVVIAIIKGNYCAGL